MRPSAIFGYRIGALCGLVVLVLFFLPGQEQFHTAGPSNTGHESLECQDCHVPAAGTMRQQLQANTRYWLGMRESPVDFQHQPVSNAQCLGCHTNPQDAHPVHRFNEPRFAEAREAIHPETCVSCHAEHEGVRVTADITFCSECHQNLVLKNDPVDVSHEELIAQGNWESCATCHDFHGNHVMDVPTRLDDALEFEQIVEYLQGGESPYSTQKRYQTEEKRNE